MSYRRVQHQPRPCLHCGTPYTPRRRDAKYCTSSCCTQAYYVRNPRSKKRLDLIEVPQPEPAKEVSFGKLVVASAAGTVAVKFAEDVFNLGTVARVKRLEKSVSEVNGKLDTLLDQLTRGKEGRNLGTELEEFLPSSPFIGLPDERTPPVPVLGGNRFSKQGAQFVPGDIVMSP